MTAHEVWPRIYVGDLTAAHFFIGPKLCVREQPDDHLFHSFGDVVLGFKYGRLPTGLLEKAADWIDGQLNAQTAPLLIHCSGGLHRSALVVAYWIATRIYGRGTGHAFAGKSLKYRVECAYTAMRLSRPEIEPRPDWLDNAEVEP